MYWQIFIVVFFSNDFFLLYIAYDPVTLWTALHTGIHPQFTYTITQQNINNNRKKLHNKNLNKRHDFFFCIYVILVDVVFFNSHTIRKSICINKQPKYLPHNEWTNKRMYTSSLIFMWHTQKEKNRAPLIVTHINTLSQKQPPNYNKRKNKEEKLSINILKKGEPNWEI